MRRILIITILLGLIGSLSAQYKDGPFRFTIGGSGQLSWLYTDNPDNTPGPARIAGDVEFHLDYFFEPHFAFSTGLVWSANGGNLIYGKSVPLSFMSGIYNIPAATQLTYRLNFFELPLGLKMTTREIGYSTYFADFGINPMWMNKATGDTSDGVHEKNPIFKEVSRFNVGYHGEFGINYSFGNKTSIVIAAFYKNTFLDFTTDYLDKPHDNSRVNMAGLKLGFGF